MFAYTFVIIKPQSDSVRIKKHLHLPMKNCFEFSDTQAE